tara:strand:- start:162 stop:533 length:372 start_codon:yes stop_codon:yes gene_type:complete
MNKNIGEIIREIRNKKGISLRKLAKVVKISNVSILYIEKGKINTSLPVLKGIAKGLNYNIDKLLAFANMINDDVMKIIKKKPILISNFLRAAKKLSSDDWKILTEKIINDELELNSKSVVKKC